MRSDRERLLDILDAADRVAVRVARGRAHFDADEDAQLALVRLLEILGEACASVSSETQRRHPTVPWRAAAGMRNRVIHGYFDVDHDLVWIAAEREVPALAEDVRRVLDEVTAEGSDRGGDE